MTKPLANDRILIVDDEENARELFALWLSEEGYDTATAADGDAGLVLARESSVDAVVLDLRVPPGIWGGIETLKALKLMDPSLPVIIVSNKADVRRAVQCIKEGAYDFIDKQDAKAELAVTVRNALKMRMLEQRAEELAAENRLFREEAARRFQFANLIGASDRMQAVYRIISRVAPTDASVLILGETGTGKELVAGAIHYSSHKKDGPFIKVNCAALPETLLEDELFGHEKGAFTGAETRRQGRFELAHGGTIFLDEVGDMSLATQAKVLRVLQEKEFERVGGSRTIKVDVRVIAATNRDLKAMIAAGNFREDLYYRLNDVTVSLPALRERKEDIPLLARHFMDKFGGRYAGKELSPEGLRALTRYSWPGNVRELEKVLKTACILAEGEVVQVSDLPEEVRGPLKASAEEIAAPGTTLAELEQLLIRRTLEHTGGNVSEAARLLGLTWQSLDRRLEKYRLKR